MSIFLCNIGYVRLVKVKHAHCNLFVNNCNLFVNIYLKENDETKNDEEEITFDAGESSDFIAR